MNEIDIETTQQISNNASKDFYSILKLLLIFTGLSYGIAIVNIVFSSIYTSLQIHNQIMGILIFTPIILSTTSILLYLLPIIFYAFRKNKEDGSSVNYEDIIEKQSKGVNALYRFRNNAIGLFMVLSTIMTFSSIIYLFILYILFV